MGDKKQYKKIFNCNGCNNKLEATIEPDKGIGLFLLGRGPRSTELSYTCPSEKANRSLPITINTAEYPFKHGKIVSIKLITSEKGARP